MEGGRGWSGGWWIERRVEGRGRRVVGKNGGGSGGENKQTAQVMGNYTDRQIDKQQRRGD